MMINPFDDGRFPKRKQTVSISATMRNKKRKARNRARNKMQKASRARNR